MRYAQCYSKLILKQMYKIQKAFQNIFEMTYRKKVRNQILYDCHAPFIWRKQLLHKLTFINPTHVQHFKMSSLIKRKKKNKR